SAGAGSGYGPTDRLALAQAIDRSRLTDLALFGSMLAAPATDLLPAGVPGHLNRQLPGYDPAAAKNALDQASFPQQIDLYFSTNSTVGRVATDLQDQLSAATGRTVVLHPTGDFFNQAAGAVCRGNHPVSLGERSLASMDEEPELAPRSGGSLRRGGRCPRRGPARRGGVARNPHRGQPIDGHHADPGP